VFGLFRTGFFQSVDGLTAPKGCRQRVAAAMLMTAEARTVKKARLTEHFQEMLAPAKAGVAPGLPSRYATKAISEA